MAAALAFILVVSCGGGGGSASVPVGPGPGPGPTPQPAPGLPSFVDESDAAGVDLLHHGFGSYLSTGQAFGDYDRDGWLDLYLTDQVGPNTLLHNDGDGTFSTSPLSALVALPAARSGGCVFADVDNDGWLDLYVCNQGPNVLFHNDQGRGFTDVTAQAGVGEPGMGMSAAFGDYDGDGWLDLYVCNWLCNTCGAPPLQAMSDRLFHNRGDGTFEDATALLGPQLPVGYGFIGMFVDFDDDGDADIYLVNDKGAAGVSPPTLPMNRNVLWRNDGPATGGAGWRFTEVAVQAGADARIDGMGLAIADYDHDGHLDLAMTDNQPPTVLRNGGDGSFHSVATAIGVTAARNTVTFGALFADLDNDAFADLFFACASGDCLLFENRRDGGFVPVPGAAGARGPGYTIGAAQADFDRDGWLDVVLCDFGDRFRLYRNQGLPAAGNWFRARLEGGGGVNRDAVGARVYLTTADGDAQVQEVACGTSIGSGSDLALHFGLGANTGVQQLVVRWPDGLVETFADLPANREWQHRHP